MIGGLNVERGKLYSDEQHYFISRQPQNLPETGVILSRRSGQHSLKALKSLGPKLLFNKIDSLRHYRTKA
jgi:hypothetical protein